jgi:hypothetical protein
MSNPKIQKWLPVVIEVAKMISEKVRKGEWTMRFRKETKDQFQSIDGNFIQIKDFIEAQKNVNEGLLEEIELLKNEIVKLKGGTIEEVQDVD